MHSLFFVDGLTEDQWDKIQAQRRNPKIVTATSLTGPFRLTTAREAAARGTDKKIIINIRWRNPDQSYFRFTAGLKRYASSDDGFSFPRTLQEFVDQYPDLVPRYAARRVHNPDARRDIVQEIYAHLADKPEDSIFSKPGSIDYPAGCTQRIQMFDPASRNVATEKAWKGWVYKVLDNIYRRIMEKDGRSPIGCQLAINISNLTTELVEPRSTVTVIDQRIDRSRVLEFYRAKKAQRPKLPEAHIITLCRMFAKVKAA